mmetsp:Transcript_7222/g.16531  ORF Transcript_7222/g.16531 Transcript_7222/m.16531 type:complete len:233 (+) Transcript_7222:1543-2241(+)
MDPSSRGPHGSRPCTGQAARQQTRVTSRRPSRSRTGAGGGDTRPLDDQLVCRQSRRTPTAADLPLLLAPPPGRTQRGPPGGVTTIPPPTLRTTSGVRAAGRRHRGGGRRLQRRRAGRRRRSERGQRVATCSRGTSRAPQSRRRGRARNCSTSAMPGTSTAQRLRAAGAPPSAPPPPACSLHTPPTRTRLKELYVPAFCSCPPHVVLHQVKVTLVLHRQRQLAHEHLFARVEW